MTALDKLLKSARGGLNYKLSCAAGLFVSLGAFLAAATVNAAPVGGVAVKSFTVADISSEADVSTAGTYVFAVTANSRNYTVNNQTFIAGYSWSSGWDKYFWFDGAKYRKCGGYNNDPNILPQALPSSISTNYKNALNGIKRSGAQDGAESMNAAKVGFRGFEYGHIYELQLWASYAGVASGTEETFTIGGVEIKLVLNVDGTGIGQFATVRFVACAPQSEPLLLGDGVSFGGQWNMIQVRDLGAPTPGSQIKWAPSATGDGSLPVWDESGRNWEGKTQSDKVWSEGSEITAKFESASSLQIDADIIAGGVDADSDLSISVTNSLNPIVGDMAVDGNLAVSGAVNLRVAGDLEIGGSLAMIGGWIDSTGTATVPAAGLDATLSAPVIDTENAYVPNSARLSVVSPLVVNLASGVGEISTTGKLTVNTAADVAFTGALSGSEFEKKGSGKLTYTGKNSAGAVVVSEGTLRLSSPLKMNGIIYDFDASGEGSLVEEDGTVTSWRDSSGTMTYAYNPDYSSEAPISTTDYFGGLRGVLFGGADGNGYTQLLLDTLGLDVQSIAFVYHELTARQYATLWGEHWYESYGIGRRNTSPNRWVSRIAGKTSTNRKYVDLVEDSEWGNITSQKTGMLYACDIAGCYRHSGNYSANKQALGAQGNKEDTTYGFHGVIGEVVAFDRDLSHPERRVLRDYLLSKWGHETATYDVLSPSAEVSVASNAVLDLGEFVGVQVKSVELADGATVAFDALPMDGVVMNLSDGSARKHNLVKVVVGTRDLSSKYRLVERSDSLKVEKKAAFYLFIR